MGHQPQPLAVTLVEQPLHERRQHHRGGQERRRRQQHHRGEKRHLEPNQKQPPALAVVQEKLLLVMTKPCHTENLERRAVFPAARVASLPSNKKESVLATMLAE